MIVPPIASSLIPSPLTPSVVESSSTSSSSIRSRVAGMAIQIWKGVSHATPVIRHGASRVWKGIAISSKGIRLVVPELLDFKGVGGTKHPLASIQISYSRLYEHDPHFADCIHSLAKQVAGAYLDNAKMIQDLLCEWIQGIPSDEQGLDQPSFIAKITDWFMNLNKELFAQTIEANILHLAANLADAAFNPDHSFADRKHNPFGRLLSVIGACFFEYEERLEKIAQLPAGERAMQYPQVFRELSVDLLEKCFPQGARDIQLFHKIPVMKLLKEFIWKTINAKLPYLLERLYQETRPLGEKHKQWKEDFDKGAPGLKADSLFHLPSDLLQQFIRRDRARLLDSLEFNPLLIKYAKEFLLTEDAHLKKMGAFFERYFMEQILFNLSQFVPEVIQIPIPLYILKKWIEGDIIKTLHARLSGDTLEADQKTLAICQILAPFGFLEKERFPLPPTIKESAWSSIEEFIQDSLPDIVIDKIPQWEELTKRKRNQIKINLWLNNFSLATSLSRMIQTGVDGFLQPSPPSSKDSELSKQWQALLKEDKSVKILKEFTQECLEALTLQLCVDLYKNYQKLDQFVGFNQLFQGSSQIDEEVPHFSVWLFITLNQAFGKLSFKEEDELENFQRAIDLKHALIDPQDPVQAQKDRDELNTRWMTIQPKFNHLVYSLLEMLGYREAAHLPVPGNVQAFIWKMMTTKLPRLLFEQMGDFMLPILEKQHLQDQVGDLPNGELIQRGCEYLAKDMIEHLPKWLVGKFDILPKNFLDDILNRADPAYEPFWQCVESYFQGIFLKVAIGISKMRAEDFQKMRTLACQTKCELLSLGKSGEKERVQKILVHFTDQLLALIGLEFPQNLFGIPEGLQTFLLKLIKEKMAQGLLGIYQLDKKIRYHVAGPNPVEIQLPTAEVAKATFALTRYSLDQATDKLTECAGKKLKRVEQIYDLLNVKLKGYKIVELFQSLRNQDILTSPLLNLFNLLDSPSWKEDVTNWINPVLTDQVIHSLTPILQKEAAGQAAFDQALLVTLLSVFTRHLRHLNEVSELEDELSVESLIDIAEQDQDLHPAVSLNREDKKAQKQHSQEQFYKKQAHLLFQLICPNGKQDVEKLLPDFSLSDDQWKSFSTSIQETAALQLSHVVEAFFDRETLQTIFHNLFATVIDNLDQPIQISNEEELSPLTQEQQSEVNQLIGEFIIEAGHLIELPDSLIKRLGKESICESIGKMIGKQLNGKWLSNMIRQTLSTSAEKKYIKPIAQEEIEEKTPELKFKDLEKKLIQRSLAYVVRYIGAHIEHATDIFRNPVLKFVHTTVISTISFGIVNVVGTLLRVFRIEQFVVNRLYQMTHYRTEKVLTVMSQPDLHENLVYHAVDAVEGLVKR